MIYTKLTKKALNVSFEAHKNQKDKNGLPYIYHPYEVAGSMENETETCVALLHDVMEDSDMTQDRLLEMGFGTEIVEALKLLTHEEGVPYLEYVRRLKNNPIAKKVKMSDLRHNMDITRLDEVKEEDLARYEKYRQAYAILNE